ncbi:class I SAM-dependent methyltransferase [Dongia soli]|uniref:Class I SAM-dependent methyltransferase n=1 Tax=Dongia soli TaxID=600628 RepID=A0ABU5EG89_9PROT|nr:class I SAM-dependent methyltransferase [Dongia soli]MDY0884874.1 class I SAM-dependent methyltransferase [Dongia soli]
MKSSIAPQLTGVPETLLWTLYNRAAEARRPDGVLSDPHSVRIHDALDYDYARSFGKADGTHAARAKLFDRLVRDWLQRHPRGLVVSLGEGLETQALRVDNGEMQWLSVDLPEVIALRERFIPTAERRRHFAGSALDRGWMDGIETAPGLCIVAQGLFMYLPEEEIRRLLLDIAIRFPGSEIIFDTIPRWFSHLTLRGLQRTRHYRIPEMPWGIDQQEILPTLRRWGVIRDRDEVKVATYRIPRGFGWLIDTILYFLPPLRPKRQAVIWARLRPPAAL